LKKSIFRVLYKAFVHLFLIFLSATILFALYYLLSNSFKTPQEFSISQFAFPKHLYLENFKTIWISGGMNVTFKNSMFISISAIFLTMIISTTAAFSFVLMNFKGKRLLSYLIISTMYISPMAIIIPLFLQMSRLKLTNSYIGLIIIYIGLSLAFSIYLMSTYFRSIPKEIIEAAIVDGCNDFNILIRIFVPLSKSGIIVLGIINFTSFWNDILFSFIFMQKPNQQTIMVSIAKFQGILTGGANETIIISGLCIAAFPPVIIYLIAQKYFRKGVMTGAIK